MIRQVYNSTTKIPHLIDVVNADTTIAIVVVVVGVVDVAVKFSYYLLLLLSTVILFVVAVAVAVAVDTAVATAIAIVVAVAVAVAVAAVVAAVVPCRYFGLARFCRLTRTRCSHRCSSEPYCWLFFIFSLSFHSACI